MEADWKRLTNRVGDFNTSEKKNSQLGLLFPKYVKIKAYKSYVPNHQPAMELIATIPSFSMQLSPFFMLFHN